VSNTTDFLRSHGEGELRAEGRPLHTGRTQQLWEVLIRRSSDHALVARGQVRFQTLTELPAEHRARG
jgi:1,4-dihydroxy-2-naphthoyl-CoA hydrolase